MTGILARTLTAERDRFNAKFAEAHRAWPKLEGAAFGHLLRTMLAPIVEAVEQARPAKTEEVTEALYDLALELLGQELLGAQSRYPHIAEGWTALLPRVPGLVAEAPRQMAGAVTNALYNLSITPGARPTEWVQALLKLADGCPDVPTLLMAGQVAAWRAGLAHYRRGALAVCGQLASANPKAARLALGLTPASDLTLDFVLGQLAADPWRLPSAVQRASPLARLGSSGARRLRLVARVGAFRGFGGEFLAPPVVFIAEGRLIVRDGAAAGKAAVAGKAAAAGTTAATEEAGCWQLSADVFGATLHRVPSLDTWPNRPQNAVPDGWRPVVGRGGLAAFPELQTVTSVAADETTLAVTTSLSHRVYLLAQMEAE